MQEDQNNTQNLQQKLLSTRYSVVDKIITLKNSLDKQKMNRRLSSEKLEQMKKRVMKLENKDRKQKYQAKLYQRKLEKLEHSQDMISEMAHLKGKNIQEREEDLYYRREFCLGFKQEMNMQRRSSMDYLELRKKERIKKFKEQKFNLFLEGQRRSEMELQSRRKSSGRIKEEESLAKQRLRRYQQFKLAQAEFNYQMKKEKQLVKQKKLAKQLISWKKEKQKEEDIFRKTQFLHRQTKKAESLYLTSAE